MLKIADAQLCPICGGMVHLTLDRSYFNPSKEKGDSYSIEVTCNTCNLKMTEFSGITGGPNLDYDSTLNALITRWNSLPSTRPIVAATTDPNDYEIDENTTWLDLATKYKPNIVSGGFVGGVRGCPLNLKCCTENAPSLGNSLCASTSNGSGAECRVCWNRKVLAPTTSTEPLQSTDTAPQYAVDENTTWRDLAKQNEPERLGEDWGGGVSGCPANLKLAPTGAPACAGTACMADGTGSYDSCRACWDSKVQAPHIEVKHEGSLNTNHHMNNIIHQIATTKECSIETAQELDRLMHEEKLLPPQLYLRMNLLGGCMQVLTAPDVQSHQVAFPFQSKFNFDHIEDIPDFLLQLYGMVDKYNEYLSKPSSVVFRPDKDEVIY